MNDSHLSSTPPRAFVAAPDPKRYFPAAVMEEARQKISRGIDRGEGPALLVGPAGTGKTLLLEVLAQQFRDQRVIVSLPGAQLCSRRALLQMILFQLGLPFSGIEEGELRVSLLRHLRPQDGPARRMLLLVDEAESLPARLLEELRVLTNVADQGCVLVSLVLAGSATLEERFAEPKMEVLNQRIATRCYLSALGREEAFQYIRAQIAATGDEPDQLFSVDGLEAMFAATDGVPRLLNQLGDQLLWMAQETGYSPLDGAIVQQAWSELQQLPAPWDMTSASPVESVAGESVVEFGELSLDENDPLERAFDNEAEDEQPASIPLFGSQHSASSDTKEHFAETFDVADQLVEQLHQLERNGSVSVPQEVAVPMTQNPFAESFESEEVVLDRYLEFEGQLLATAQRVVNQIDTSFAQQLSYCEIGHDQAVQTSVVATRVETQVISPSDLSPSELPPRVYETPLDYEKTATQLEETTLQAEDLPDNEPAAGESPVNNPLISELDTVNMPVPSQPGKLLVVEDLGRSAAVVVPGDKFRHLFSSLEANAECGLRNAE